MQDYWGCNVTESNLLLLCYLAKVFNVEFGHDDGSAAFVEAHVQDDGQAIDVEERKEGKDSVGWSQRRFGSADLEGVCNDVLVAQHDTLGQTGSAARVYQESKIFLGINLCASIAIGAGGVADRGKVLDSHFRVSLVADQNDTVFR